MDADGHEKRRVVGAASKASPPLSLGREERALCIGGPLDGRFVPVLGTRTVAGSGGSVVEYPYHVLMSSDGKERVFLALTGGAEPMAALRVLMDAYSQTRAQRTSP